MDLLVLIFVATWMNTSMTISKWWLTALISALNKSTMRWTQIHIEGESLVITLPLR